MESIRKGLVPLNSTRQVLKGLVSFRGDHPLSPQQSHKLIRIVRAYRVIIIGAKLAHAMREGYKLIQVDLPPRLDRSETLFDGGGQTTVVVTLKSFSCQSFPFALKPWDQFFCHPFGKVTQTSPARPQ